MPKLGALIRAYRRGAGLTQQELAEGAGLSVAAVRDIEQCRRLRPRPSSLAAIADALGLDGDQAADLVCAATCPRDHPDAAASTGGLPAGFAPAEGPAVPGQGLWLAAIGPLEAWRDGKPLALGPPARRVVLGLLVMASGASVSRDTIIDVLWGESAPGTSVGSLQAHVSRLRKVLAPSKRLPRSDVAIDSAGSAYRLRVTPGALDLLVFKDLAARAGERRADGDDLAACELYEQTVGLWRGTPFADLDLLRGHPGSVLVRQQYIGALLKYSEVAFALRRYNAVLPRLRTLAAVDPLNEPVHARLMIALAGAGHQASAIRVYESLRARLDRELGLYPSAELAGAHRQVLRQEIGVAYARHPRGQALAQPGSELMLPRQLPAGPRFFAGRADELSALSGLLDQDSGEPGGVTIAALTGMAGIGKTALAVHWAHLVTDRFPGGQLFADLHGFGPSGPTAPSEAVSGFLTALGVPTARIPTGASGQTALYRSLLVGRSMLIVLDNAQDAEQVRALLPGSPGCLVLVTSRKRLIGLAAADSARLLSLEVLTGPESHDLLISHLRARATADPAVSELIALCSRLPLALCNVAARAAACPSLPLARLAAQMGDDRGRLDAMETGDPASSIRTVFSWSYGSLSKPAQRMFRLLGTHPGADITVAAAASMVALPRREASLLVAELCDQHMITELTPGRYTCHDLLRAFAAETARSSDSTAELRIAAHRLLDHYLHTASAASAVLYPCRIQLTPHTPGRGVLPEDFGDAEQAAEWLEGERDVLLAAFGQAADDGHAPHAWELPWVTGPFFEGERYWARLAAAQESALALAGRLDDLAGQALARHHLGLLHSWLGEYESARRHLDEAGELAMKLGDDGLLAQIVNAHAHVPPSRAENRTR